MYQELSKGWIEVITGPMFAGKSEELLRRIRILRFSKQNIICFKPSIDDRYSKDEIASHAGGKYKAYAVKNVEEMKSLIKDNTDVVAIDEIQFFSHDVIGFLESLADKGIRVIVAGLDMDFRGEPFGVLPELLTRAEFVTKLTAVCAKCGAPATRTQRLVDGHPASFEDPIVLVGAVDHYEPRCRHCHEILNKPHKF